MKLPAATITVVGLFGCAIFAVAGGGSSHAADVPAASQPAQVTTLPDLVVEQRTQKGYALNPACANGTSAVTFNLLVGNVGDAPSSAIGASNAVWVQDSNHSVAWASGASLPAIAPHATVNVDVTLMPLYPASVMAGEHVFTVTVNPSATIAEKSRANNSTTIDVTIPAGFCPTSPTVSAMRPIAHDIASGPHTATQPIPASFTLLSPTNLHQPSTASECLSHVPNGGQGFWEHDAYGCSHPTAGYITLVWDWSGQADGFHIYRVDGQRRDYGIHHDGTMEFVYSSGFACFVVAAVRGSSESHDSNRYCVAPTLTRITNSYTGIANVDAAAKRLRAIGLNSNDPNLALKLQAHLARTEAAYLTLHRAHKPVFRLLGPSSTTSASGSTRIGHATANATTEHPQINSNNIAHATMPFAGTFNGTVEKVYSVGSSWSLLGSNPELTPWTGYYFLVRTSVPASLPYWQYNGGQAAQTTACLAKSVANASFEQESQTGPGPLPSPSNGSYWYWAALMYEGLPIGRARAGQLSMSFTNIVIKPMSVTFDPSSETTTIDLTIDSSPALVSNSYGVGSSNITLAAPGSKRLGSGDWKVQTSGDDLIGLSITPGSGWTATASVVSANSTADTSDYSPDNSWRGATVTAAPTASDMRTAVHWHYSGIDSLTYTLEWKLVGPSGQRPVSSMPLGGACDS